VTAERLFVRGDLSSDVALLIRAAGITGARTDDLQARVMQKVASAKASAGKGVCDDDCDKAPCGRS